MSVAQEMRFKIRLSDGLIEQPQRGMLGYGDQRANKIIIEMMTDGGQPADLMGVTAAGSFYAPPDGDEIGLTGTISGNKITVPLIAKCYAAEGRFSCEIRLTSGNEKRTVLAISGQVLRFGSGAIASVAGVTNIDELLAEIGAMREATAAANAAVDRAQTLVDAARAVNLLDNSDFRSPINQRGQTSYGGTSGYKIDRWRSGTLVSWTLHPGEGLEISNAGTNSNGIAQILSDDIAPGERVTMALELMSGEIVAGSVAVPASGSARAGTSQDGTLYTLVYPKSESSDARVQIMLAPGASAQIKWAALYYGNFTAETLPAYRPRRLAEEMAACQREYVRFTGYASMYGYTSGAGSAYVYKELPVAMRATPTVTLDGATLTIRGADGEAHQGVMITGATGMHGNTLRIGVSDAAQSLPQKSAIVATVSATDGVMAISCER